MADFVCAILLQSKTTGDVKAQVLHEGSEDECQKVSDGIDGITCPDDDQYKANVVIAPKIEFDECFIRS